MAFEGKERQKDEGIHIENAERLVTEIEMLKAVMYLFRNRSGGRR